LLPLVLLQTFVSSRHSSVLLHLTIDSLAHQIEVPKSRGGSDNLSNL
jgi:hypothetical protein